MDLPTNRYTFPKDGYIYVSCATNAALGSTYINVGIYDVKNTQICSVSAISNGTYPSSNTMYVKKGMSAEILNNYGVTYAHFIPLE